MAYRIECDRCENTEAVTTVGEIPSRWLQFNTIWRGSGEGNNTLPPIDGGVFCASCAKDLERWRKPIPRSLPASAA